MPRFFTWREAQRELPRIAGLVREAVERHTRFRESERALQDISRRITMLGGVSLDRAWALETRRARDRCAASLNEAIERVQETGCVLKDLEMGLIDFPALYHGQEVCLCWKLGEPAIEYWHGTDEGFAGRKPIDGDFPG